MKMICEILSADGCGMNLRLKVQARQIGAADWRDFNAFEIEIPAHERTKKAFHVGRMITIEVKT